MTDQRLLRSQRIKKPSSFTAAIRKGIFLRGTLLNIWFIQQEEAGLLPPSVKVLAKKEPSERPAVGIMVSKKVHLRAVKRNLWKRRIREAFRRNQNKFKPGWALVIQARKQVTIPLYTEIEKELSRLCVRANVMEK
jgi:ribonuclease P protein component